MKIMKKYLKLSEVLSMTGISRTGLYRHMNKLNDFPKPELKVFEKYNRWSIEQIENWFEKQKVAK